MGSTVVGYKYYVGMHLVYCHGPIDALLEIKVDDKIAWTGTSTGGQISINKTTLFGPGKTGPGGISGSVDVEMGKSDQGVNSYLGRVLTGAPTPAFRGVFGLVLRQLYIGNSTYMKPWVIKAKRILTRTDGSAQWYPAKAAIGNDMNPAHIIMETLVDSRWGMGYNLGDIDEASFTAAADTFYAEGLGISVIWDNAMSVESFQQTILDHVDATLYLSETTGKFQISPIRNDFVDSSLLVLDQSNVKSVTNYGKTAVGDMINSVTIVYEDGTTGEEATVTVQNLALINVQGKVVAKKIEFPGFSTAAAATYAANRELAKLSRPLLRCTITANRDAAGLTVGRPFKLSWPKLGLSSVVMRAVTVDTGTLDKPEVKIECVEDIFKSTYTIYSAPSGSAWVNPVSAPTNPAYRLMMESTFYDLAQAIGESAAKTVPVTSGFAAITAVRPSGGAINATLYSKPSGIYTEYGTADFCPSAQIAGDLDKVSTVIGLTGGVDLDTVEVGTCALIDNEIVIVTAISDTSMTVGRGAQDTVPATHVSGSRVWFYEGYAGSDNIEYTSGETAYYKLLTNTGSDQLALASATENAQTITGRPGRPYPPGSFKIQAQSYPALVVGDTISVSWTHRDRTQLTAAPVPTTYGNVGPETGVTYTVQYLNSAGSQLFIQTGVTGTSYTLTSANLGTTDFDGVKVKVWADRAGTASYQVHDHQFDRTGYGLDYGNYYGGM